MLKVNWENENPLDLIGFIIAFIMLCIELFMLASTTIVGGIILAIFLWARWSSIEKMTTTKGFGTGIIIYLMYIIIGVMVFVTLENNMSGGEGILYILMFIIMLFILPLISKNAKTAAPFFLLMLTIGLIFVKAESDSSDNSSNSSIDIASASDNTSSFIDTSSTDLNTNISTDNSTFNNVNTNVNTSIPPITNNINETVINNNVDFNTPTQDNPSAINITSADFTNQATINTNTGVITGSEGQIIGSVSQDGNTTIIKDNMSNTILSKDETTGFVYDEEGKPQGIVDNNGDIKTYYDTNTGETKIVDGGTIYNSEGKIEGHIQKK